MIITLISVGILVIGIIGFIIADKFHIFCELLDNISIAAFIIGLIASTICITIIVLTQNSISRAKDLAEYKERYTVLTYALKESEPFVLADEVSAYNSEIRKGRIGQHSEWVNWFYCNFYDELPLIELESEN